jgi:hypothetical protein
MLAARTSGVTTASPGAVRCVLAMRTAFLAGMVYAARMFRIMAFIILACQSDSEKPEAGLLA